MRVWRLIARPHAATAFSGIGNKKAGSRWVPEGELAVYTSEHPSTAVLENLVHMEPSHFQNNYVLISADIPDELAMDVVSIESLEPDWQIRYEDEELQQVGKDWIERGESAVLIVPSAVMPQERNLILNPLHPDFAKIVIHEPEDFRFDGRLIIGNSTNSTNDN
ncbi:MAG: RES family NAD+ phosphorylase [Pseudomonadota bacterium]